MTSTTPHIVPHLKLLEVESRNGAVFEPDVIDLMSVALQNAIAELPHPIGSRHAHSLAKSILAQASKGERDLARLSLVALETLGRS